MDQHGAFTQSATASGGMCCDTDSNPIHPELQNELGKLSPDCFTKFPDAANRTVLPQTRR